MFEVRPLTPSFGVEVTGLDMSTSITQEDTQALDQLLDRAFVVLIRGNPISAERQLDLARAFGVPDARILEQLSRIGHRAAATSDLPAPIQHVSSVRHDGVLGGGELSFHNDELFFSRPSRATMLHAIDVPSRGGETLFADIPTFFERMPSTKTKALEAFHALHTFGYSDSGNVGIRPVVPVNPSVPQHLHPLIHRDPVTGRSSIWLSLSNTVHLVEADAAQSEAIIQDLCARIAASDLIYVHEWKVGDTLIWNNLMVQHARRDFPPAEPRTLRRVTMG